jgi:hypothetical protein
MSSPMSHHMDEQSAALFRYEEALSKARRIVAMYGAHWRDDPAFESLKWPPKPCSCGLVNERRELAELVRAAQG